jgi:hypothetical protein
MLGPWRKTSPSWPVGSSVLEVVDMIFMLMDGRGLPTEPLESFQSVQPCWFVSIHSLLKKEHVLESIWQVTLQTCRMLA